MGVFVASDFPSVGTRARKVAAGEIVSIARGLWSDDVNRDPTDVVRDNWMTIVGKMLPGAVISDRSGFALRPIGGELYVSHARGSKLVLPGLIVYPDGRSDNHRPDDVPLDPNGRLFGSSPARALVDNAEKRGRPGSVQRRLTREELHDHVVKIVTTYTPRQVENMLAIVDRDANKVAAESVRVFVDAARGNTIVKTSSRAMNAAQRGETYDQARVALFRQVAADLQRLHPVQRFVADQRRAQMVPFYEAYFSNYIEGSTLTIDEAERVVFLDADVGKPEDAHDIRSTWVIVSDVAEMSRRPADADEFMDALRDRHRVMMAAHPQKHPGEWKTQRNQAGATVFVDPGHVVGTLRAGWEEGQILTDPFQRAVYTMFLVSEVHPFIDGNGRSARVAMNAELVPAGMHRIVIPTVLRNDYMSGLSRATAGNGPDGLHTVLAFAQDWVARGEFPDLETGDRYVRATNALYDAGVADREGIHLKLLKFGELFELDDIPYPSATTPEPQPSFLDAAVAAGAGSDGT
ncbi:Fic family protein [Herbiconiux daphne]|uniref:Fic family protein n=1 Tax=Herbiconiux daphne TaxID=2970914 RepID=A0ABT2GY49_9MICO|nr:Fic family protein [Herbiconiux daphne]MCS5732862.1 Fic family protein [Herbiconiux daphne]